MKLKDQLGKGSWSLKRLSEPNISSGGVDEIWFKKDATLDELLDACRRVHHWDIQPNDYFYWQEWVKDGRKIVRRETARLTVLESRIR